MTPLAVVLILISAVVHAGWNYLGKRRTPTASFFLVANTGGSLLLLPFIAMHVDQVLVLPVQVLVLVTATGFFQALYYTSLAGAYRAGDMSIAYPLARSSPIIVVTASAYLLGRGDEISLLCGAGAALVVIGCFLVPMRRIDDLRLANYVNVGCALALLAAVGTAGYSIIDDAALKIVRDVPDWGASTMERTLVYAGLEAITSSFWLLVIVLPRPAGRASLATVWRSDRWPAYVTGVGIFATYCLVLVAMAHARDVSYIVAFRQVSIPLGVFLGVVFLKEPLHLPKLLGVAVLLAGLAMVAAG